MDFQGFGSLGDRQFLKGLPRIPNDLQRSGRLGDTVGSARVFEDSKGFAGMSVAHVFSGIPKDFQGSPVISADLQRSQMRFDNMQLCMNLQRGARENYHI